MNANVSELLIEAARRAPDKVAVVDITTGRRTTWAELEDEVARVAHGLAAAGMVAGYRVMIAISNRTEFITCYLGALRARLVAVPVNPRSTTGELARMIADSGSRMVIGDAATIANVRQSVAGLADALDGADEELAARVVVPRVVTVGTTLLPGEQSYDQLIRDPGRELPVATDDEALAVLLYTSGTSGRPRAAMLTHRALVANVDQAMRVKPEMIHADDVVLGVLPLFHVYGLNAVLGQVIGQAARLVLVEGFDPEGSLNIIDDEAVSVLPVAPPVFAYWMPLEGLEDRLGSVRLVLSGSAPLSPEVIAAFQERTGVAVHQGYGLTEAAPVVTSTLCSSEAKIGSVGSALPDVEIRLVDDDGHPPEGEDPGEIQIRGANLFSGYWPDGTDGPGPEGWWGTGDVGFLDPDGDLFLVDRLKELVIVSGFNVYPVEVEDVISELDVVVEAAVIGVPDPMTGEAVAAFVKAAPGHSAEDVVARVEAHCAERLARFKRPTAVTIVDQLPHTVTGKVAKGRLRATERRRALGLLE